MKSRKQYHICLGLVFCVFLVTRLWRVGMVPFGLHYDEAGMAYDAWCLSRYGVDRYLNPWPLYLTNYGGGQSVLYAYLCAALFQAFGYHILLVRLPSILFSALTFVFGAKLMEKLYPGDYLPALAAAVLLTICPAPIMQGRLGVDCFLMLGASTVFLYLFVCAVEKDSGGLYVGAGLAGGILLYTYALTYLMLPLFLGISLLYVIRIGKFSMRRWAVMAVPTAVLAFPLILIQVINLFDLPEGRLGIFTLTKLNVYRISEITGFRLSRFVEMLKQIFYGNEFAYTSAPGFFNFYVLTVPLFCIGMGSLCRRVWRSVRRREYDAGISVFLWFLIHFFLFCCLNPNGYRITGIYFSVTAISACGLQTVLRFLRERSPFRAAGAVGTAVIAAVYLVCFVRFGIYYYMGEYTVTTAPLAHFDITVTEGIAWLEEHPEYQNRGVYMAEPPTYYLLSTLTSPYELVYDCNRLDHDYYVCGSLPEIQDGYNYIVRDIFWEYAQELRQRGYAEEAFTGYSLFYQERKKE